MRCPNFLRPCRSPDPVLPRQPLRQLLLRCSNFQHPRRSRVQWWKCKGIVGRSCACRQLLLHCSNFRHPCRSPALAALVHPCPSEQSLPCRSPCPPNDPASKLAGVPGLEPGNAGIKIRCLTTWLHPNGMLVLHSRKWMSINPARDKTFEPFWAPFNDLCALTLVLHR